MTGPWARWTGSRFDRTAAEQTQTAKFAFNLTCTQPATQVIFHETMYRFFHLGLEFVCLYELVIEMPSPAPRVGPLPG
jgi:hypothetical protein